MSTKFLQIVGSNFDSKSIVTLKVPVLAEGATEYTEEDKSSIQTAINQIAETDKPVVILDYNGAYMPANYFNSDTHHYFAVFATDKVVDESGDLYLIYIDYDTSNSALVIRNDVTVGGIQSDWNQTDETQKDYIKNKPTIPSIEGLATETYVDDKTVNVLKYTEQTLTDEQKVQAKTNMDIKDTVTLTQQEYDELLASGKTISTTYYYIYEETES